MPQIIIDFDSQEAMDHWKAITGWDLEAEPSAFDNEPDAREEQMYKEIEESMTITEVEDE